MHQIKRLLVIVFACTLTAAPMMAQESEDEARAFVEQALENLNQLPAYHFSYTMTTFTEFVAENSGTTTYTETIAEGDALADRDNATRFRITSATDAETAEATPPLRVARTVFRGIAALNFNLEDTIYEDMLGIKAGWHTYEELTAAYGDQLSQKAFIDFVNNLPLPSDFLQHPNLIESVEELESTTFGDVDVRVFRVEIDALRLMLERTPDTQQMQMLQNLRLLAMSEFEVVYEIWIGSDDGQVHWGSLSEFSSIPYRTASGLNTVPFDITTDTDITFTISAHGADVEIEPVVLPK